MASKLAEKVENLGNVLDATIAGIDAEIARVEKEGKALPPSNPAAVALDVVHTNLQALSAKASKARAELTEPTE